MSDGLPHKHHFRSRCSWVYREGSITEEGRDTDFYTDGSLSNQEGNAAIKHVVF